MTRFHANSTTGDIGICRAEKGECPFGQALHGDSRREAEEAFASFVGIEEPKKFSKLREVMADENNANLMKASVEYTKLMGEFTAERNAVVAKLEGMTAADPEWAGLVRALETSETKLHYLDPEAVDALPKLNWGQDPLLDADIMLKQIDAIEASSRSGYLRPEDNARIAALERQITALSHGFGDDPELKQAASKLEAALRDRKYERLMKKANEWDENFANDPMGTWDYTAYKRDIAELNSFASAHGLINNEQRKALRELERAREAIPTWDAKIEGASKEDAKELHRTAKYIAETSRPTAMKRAWYARAAKAKVAMKEAEYEEIKNSPWSPGKRKDLKLAEAELAAAQAERAETASGYHALDRISAEKLRQLVAYGVKREVRTPQERAEEEARLREVKLFS